MRWSDPAVSLMYLPFIAAALYSNCWQQGNDKAQDSLVSPGLKWVNADAQELPPTAAPALSPCPSSFLQHQPPASPSLCHPLLWSVAASTSSFPPKLQHQHGNARNEFPRPKSVFILPFLFSQSQFQDPEAVAVSSLLLPAYSFLTTSTRAASTQKKPTKFCTLSWCIVSPAADVSYVWGCQDLWVTGAQTMSMESCSPRFLQQEPMNLLCIMEFVHHLLTFITSPVRRTNCYYIFSKKVYHQNLVFFLKKNNIFKEKMKTLKLWLHQGSITGIFFKYTAI